MNTQPTAGQLTQDELDQQELDQAYNAMHGITPGNTPNTPEPQSEVLEDDAQGNAEDTDTPDAEDPLKEVSDDEQITPEEDAIKDDAKKDDEHDDDGYVDLENSLEDDESLIKPDDPIGVQKRIGKEVQRRKVLEAEIAQMKAQQEQIMRMMMGQAPNSMVPGMMPPSQPNGQTPQDVPFVPPPLPKPYEEMNEYERFNYFQQVKAAETQAKQIHSQQQMQQHQFVASFEKAKAALNSAINKAKEDADEKTYKVLTEIMHSDKNPYTQYMAAALGDYSNCASLARHLYLKHPQELMALRTKSPDEQTRGIVRLAERTNLERKQAFDKKASAKKPIPAGKNKNAVAPKTFAKKDIYSDTALLERAAGDPKLWDQLIAKGY